MEFESTTDQINHTLVKAFVICGIAWHIIENPFFIDFLKTLRPSYQPPSRKVLSGRLLAQEAAVINQQVINQIGNDNFSAIVSDAGANIKLACGTPSYYQ